MASAASKLVARNRTQHKVTNRKVRAQPRIGGIGQQRFVERQGGSGVVLLGAIDPPGRGDARGGRPILPVAGHPGDGVEVLGAAACGLGLVLPVVVPFLVLPDLVRGGVRLPGRARAGSVVADVAPGLPAAPQPPVQP